MIIVKISLMGSLRDKKPDSDTIALASDRNRILDLLDILQIPLERVHVVTVNGRFEHDYTHVLQDKDVVTVLPLTFSHACEVPAESA